jgi:hypothetical protein
LARNIEIKARIKSIERLTAAVAALADQGPIEIPQDDTFFRCDAGRLKLRSFMDGTGELIYYRRADESGPKESLLDEPEFMSIRSSSWAISWNSKWCSRTTNVRRLARSKLER